MRRMRQRVAMMLLFLTAACSTRPAEQTTVAEDVALKDSLVAMIDEWERAFEPQQMSEADALDRAMRPFVQDSSFVMMIDGLYYPTFQARADTQPLRLKTSRGEMSETHHNMTAVRFLRLGRDAAALTMPYRYDFVTKTGQRGHHNSGYTMLFVRRPEGWRIVQYPGSHGPRL